MAPPCLCMYDYFDIGGENQVPIVGMEITFRLLNLLTRIDIFKNDHHLFMYSVVGWQ